MIEIHDNIILADDGRVAFSAYLLLPHYENGCDSKIVLDELHKGTASNVNAVFENLSSKQKNSLPKFKHCRICGTLMPISTGRQNRTKFCTNNCKAKAHFIKESIKKGEQVGEQFLFGHKGKAVANMIKKVEDNQYLIKYKSKTAHTSCSEITIVPKEKDARCYNKTKSIFFAQCDNEPALDDFLAEFIFFTYKQHIGE